MRPHSFLQEMKSSNGPKLELSEIVGHIIEFSADQHGSQCIQQKLETCNVEEKASVLEEVLANACTLMTDVFGNYVMQKFFKHGSPEQRKQLAEQLVGHVLELTLQLYGCCVIQKLMTCLRVFSLLMIEGTAFCIGILETLGTTCLAFFVFVAGKDLDSDKALFISTFQYLYKNWC